MAESVIEISDLRKTYSNGVEAVKGLDLQIKEGEVFGFLGPNGAGKSTSIKIMTGLISPTSGNVKVLGLNLPKQSKELASLIGYVPQELIFYNHLTVKENLELFAQCYEIENAKETILEIMKLLEIDELKDRRAAAMSGGQKRRLNLAIGLLHKPKLIFLDEPSAGMDPQSRNILWKNIETISRKEKITIILTTHLMETAEKLSDRVAIIDHGIVQVVDTPAQLKKKFSKGDVVMVKFKDEIQEEKLKELVLQLKIAFGEEETFSFDHKVSIQCDSGIEVIVQLTEFLEKHQAKNLVKEISMADTTLEDVFISITGSKLRE